MSVNVATALGVRLVSRSWSQTLVVPAGETKSVRGGIYPSTDIQVSSTIKIQSCCGLSTNDIDFSIYGKDLMGPSLSRVVEGVHSFEWNSGGDYDYTINFDNRWTACGGSPYTCADNQSSPSYHDKTVQLTVTEAASLWSFLNVLFLLPLAALIVMVFVPVLILRMIIHRFEKVNLSSDP